MMRRNAGRTPAYVADPVLSFLHWNDLGRAMTAEEIARHVGAVGRRIDREATSESTLYRAAAAQLLALYAASLGSEGLIARSRALGECIRAMRALHLLPAGGAGSRRVPMRDIPEVGRPIPVGDYDGD